MKTALRILLAWMVLIESVAAQSRTIKDVKLTGTADFSQVTNIADVREDMALQDRGGTTPLVYRRLETGANVRALVFGDSIAPEPLMGDYYSVLRLLQGHIGNAGAGGFNVNAEAVPVYGGGAASATADWFRTYHSVPAAGWVEFSANLQIRRFANTAKVAWRAPVGGTATFKIQTCADADGAGVGTWVDDPAGVRTAVASGGSEEVGFATLSITEGNYRLRVLGVSGTVNVFNLELSHSTIGGCVINYHAEGGSAFSAWGNLSDTRRKNFIDAIDPDVIFVMYKDDGPTMTASLAALAETLAASLTTGGHPRDVVIIPPFPSAPDTNPFWEATRIQREAMRVWATENRAAYIDLWDLFPIHPIFYDGPGIHAAGLAEQAHLSALIMERLGWLQYPKVREKTHPVVRTARRIALTALANTTTFAEDTNFRLPLGVGRWRITGRFQFTNDGSAGEGGKVRIAHDGATMVMYNYKRWAVNGNPQVSTWPYFGGLIGLPLDMNGCTAFDLAYGYDLDQLVINVTQPGMLIVSTAKEATGGDIHLREESFISAEKLP